MKKKIELPVPSLCVYVYVAGTYDVQNVAACLSYYMN